jgi:hypothetical protein
VSAPKPWKLEVDYDDRGVPYEVVTAGKRALVKEMDATTEELNIITKAPVVSESHRHLLASCLELLTLVHLKYGNLDPDVNEVTKRAKRVIKKAERA